MTTRSHPIYPINSDVLLVPHEYGDRYDAVALRECDASNLEDVQRRFLEYFRGNPEYCARIPKDSTLGVCITSLRANSENPKLTSAQRKKLLLDLNRAWYEYEVSKPKLTQEGYQEGVVVDSLPVKEVQIALRSAQSTAPDELSRLFQSLNRTYELSVVTPTEVLVVLRNRWSISRMISMRPLARGTSETSLFWDTDSTISIMRMFVSRYRQDPVLSVPHLRNILTQLECLLYRPLSYANINEDKGQYYTFVLAICLFSLFLYRWLVPCIEDTECKSRPSVLPAHGRYRKRS